MVDNKAFFKLIVALNWLRYYNIVFIYTNPLVILKPLPLIAK